MKIGIKGRKSLFCSKFKPFLLCVKVLRFSTLVFMMWGAACLTNWKPGSKFSEKQFTFSELRGSNRKGYKRLF